MSIITQYPVRDHILVEKVDAATSGMPSGMQPVFRNEVAFLRNAGSTYSALQQTIKDRYMV